jgi:hypothetical protein
MSDATTGTFASAVARGLSSDQAAQSLLGIVVLSVLVQLGIHHIRATQQLFHIGALSLFDCALSLIAGSVPLAVIEFTKVIRQRGRAA